MMGFDMDSSKIGPDVNIRDLWNVEQEILDVIDGICEKHHLKYTLIFGTLLGAVRHGGFIPWDDDIDIMMPREDYEKFITVWNQEKPKGYLIQNKRTDKAFSQNFTKIRKDNTTFIEAESEKKQKYHTGIFVDIFPADRVAPRGIRRKIQYIASVVNLLFARGHQSGNKGIVGIIEKLLLRMPKKVHYKLYEKTEKIISRWKNRADLCWYSPNTFAVCKRYFEPDIFDDMIRIKFNDKKYQCVECYDKLLTRIYGDYMQLPPVEDRVWKHHPLVIDIYHSYIDLGGK